MRSPTIRSPRWTKPLIVMPEQVIQVVMEGMSDERLEVRLEKGDVNVALSIERQQRSMLNHVNCTRLDCMIVGQIPERLWDLTVSWAGGSVRAENSVQLVQQFADDFRFVHTTDLHLLRPASGKQMRNREAHADRLVEAINSIRPVFVLNTGDLINRYRRNATDILPPRIINWQMRRVREIFLGLQVPMFVTAGNHDLAFPWCQSAWHTEMGSPWPRRTDDYSFDYGDYHFAALEASVDYDPKSYKVIRHRFYDEQLAWLEDDASKAKSARLRFLFCHYDYDHQLKTLVDRLSLNMVMYGHSGLSLFDAIKPKGYFVNGHLVNAYQIVTVKGAKISVEPGPSYSDPDFPGKP